MTTPSNFHLLTDLKKMFAGKRFAANEYLVIVETNTYFEVKDKLFFQKGIEMLRYIHTMPYSTIQLCFLAKDECRVDVSIVRLQYAAVCHVA